jgi:hypothetical protein
VAHEKIKPEVDDMNILNGTEDKIFEVIGKGREPKFKPIEKARLDKNVGPFDFSRLLER